MELVIAMLLGSILVLTAGTMLYYGWKVWSKNSIKMSLQGDAIYAMDMIDRTIRSVDNVGLSISGPDLWMSGSRFLYLDDGKLIRVSGAGEQAIVNNVSSISFVSVDPVVINVTLQDRYKTDSIALSFVVSSRN